MRTAMILVLVCGCGRGAESGGRGASPARDAAARPEADAGASVDAALTVRWRGDVVVPVVALAERRFVPLAGWLAPSDGAAAVAPTTYPPPMRIEATPNSSVQPRVVPGDGLPASWRAAVGTAVAAYDRAGHRCPTTIGGVYWLGLDNGEAELGEGPIVVGELTTAPGCDPIVVTDRAEPRFATPTKATPAQRAAVERAFKRLPGVKRQGRDREIDRDGLATTLFVGADGAWMVAAATYELREASCDPAPEVVRAIFALPATGAPTLVAEVDEELGLRAVGLFDSDRDGHVELITGHGRFDHGMSLETSYVGYRDLGPRAAPPDGPATDVAFSTYFGCD
ncbi:MAG: hypothetical protein IPL61_19455 [Myxococcales bacterium]|nr:hypothetical protein [Myxococcales bacterium]